MEAQIKNSGLLAFRGCVAAYNFVGERLDLVAARTTPPPGAAEEDQVRFSSLRGYYSRTFAWLNAIKRLNESTDFQPISVAARALFEATVDLGLVLFKPNPGEKDPPVTFETMFHWERSAKLMHVEQVKKFCGGVLPSEMRLYSEFLAGPEVDKIRADRQTWWKKGEQYHASRWTGRSLRKDAGIVDARCPDLRVREFYELEFAPLCWSTHGSGLASIRASSDQIVPATTATALTYVLRFSMRVTELVLKAISEYKPTDFAEFKSRLESDVDRFGAA
jgi:hypothetical protein